MSLITALDLVLDHVNSIDSYVATCLVCQEIYEARKITLIALKSARLKNKTAVYIHTQHLFECIQGLPRIWRFYQQVHYMIIFLGHGQTRLMSGRRILKIQVRFAVTALVESFHDHCKYLETDDSLVQLRSDDDRWPWMWLTDADMVIFSRCVHLDMWRPENISDEGLNQLKSARSLFLIHATSVRGYAFLNLHDNCSLRKITVCGEDGLYQKHVLKCLATVTDLWFKEELPMFHQPL